jgi:hypothetical protein
MVSMTLGKSLAVALQVAAASVVLGASEPAHAAPASRLQAPRAADPTIAALLPLGLMPLGLAAGVGLPLAIGGGSQGPLAFVCGTTLGVLGVASGHIYAGDPQRGFTLAALSGPVVIGTGLGVALVAQPLTGSSTAALTAAGYGLCVGIAGWTGYMAWDAHRVAAGEQ